ncbi:thymidylate kinase [Streptomyces sp. NPDC004647]|uniref:dTMP kinase n=1 Tax=Streptomyces sp. NPDC004647 TaxID=3154671 RepID=UPI0033B3A6A6
MTSLEGAYVPAASEPSQGRFIVLEGVSGVGKSHLARALTARLNATMLHTLPAPLTQMSSTIDRELRALPQFGFYLSGALHASDLVRQGLTRGWVVADRYVSSVTACHAAVQGIDVQAVRDLLAPFLGYLIQPDHTFYLRCSEEEIRRRMATKRDLKQDDLDLFEVPGRLSTLLNNFAAVAATDPTAVTVDTDGKSVGELADWIINVVGSRDRA